MSEYDDIKTLHETGMWPGGTVPRWAIDEGNRRGLTIGNVAEPGIIQAGLIAEIERLRAIVEKQREELDRLHDVLDSQDVSCPKCGGKWEVSRQFWGDPRFGCPHCKLAAKAARKKMDHHRLSKLLDSDVGGKAPPHHGQIDSQSLTKMENKLG